MPTGLVISNFLGMPSSEFWTQSYFIQRYKSTLHQHWDLREKCGTRGYTPQGFRMFSPPYPSTPSHSFKKKYNKPRIYGSFEPLENTKFGGKSSCFSFLLPESFTNSTNRSLHKPYQFYLNIFLQYLLGSGLAYFLLSYFAVTYINATKIRANERTDRYSSWYIQLHSIKILTTNSCIMVTLLISH